MACNAILEGDILTLETGRIRRTFDWNGGALVGRTLEDPASGRIWWLEGAPGPDVRFPGCDDEDPADGDVQVEHVQATACTPPRLEATVTVRLGTLWIRRRFRLYEDCPAIAGDLFLRGGEGLSWQRSDANIADLRNVESTAAAREGLVADTVIEQLSLPGRHWRLEALRFRDVTDRNNTLVDATFAMPYRHPLRLAGNLLFAESLVDDGGVFLLKEAPCSGVQLAWPGCDFTARSGELTVVGVGAAPEDLDDGDWTRGYGAVVGVSDGTELGRLQALRNYQRRVRVTKPHRDDMVMMNTWGDLGQDARICEAFALAELEAGARLGITHFQLDDGWQKGRSSNSAFEGGSLTGIWDDPEYWTPHPERFPNGLKPVVERGRERGIEVCLWFNPSRDDSYAHWQEDADTLVRLNSDCGVRTFKIDGVQMPDKRAETNLRRMFDTVMEALDGEAVFKLDVTAGRRYGYHFFNEYGNLFLENRYTDWSNYYPHWTLRNLWMLAPYVPTERLQIEFLNRWRNAEHYPEDDPLAPQHVPFDYCFALTMVAQPLAWFEGTGLPEEAFEIAPLVAAWREHAERMHAGLILPIGEEPCGRGWTGFQSMADTLGYVLLFRELNDRPEALVQTWLGPKRGVECRLIAGSGENFMALTDREGRLKVSLPEPFSYALYQYTYA